MISVFFGNNAEIEKVGEVESEDKLWVDLLDNFLTLKGSKNRYYRSWKIDTSSGPVTHLDFGSWSRFIYYGDETACRKYFKEYNFTWKL